MIEKKSRDPRLALFLSLVCPGLGQLYNHQLRKAILFFVVLEFGLLVVITSTAVTIFGAVVTFLVYWSLFIIGLIDAYFTANKLTAVELCRYDRWYVYLSIWIISIVIYWPLPKFIRDNYFEAFKISSESMQPTIMFGDHIVVRKLDYTKQLPQRGDIVLFSLTDDPATTDVDESNLRIIRRVIGLPGDKVEVKGAIIILNDRTLHEAYAQWTKGGVKDFSPSIVPSGTVFLLGDNRDNSKDSRFLKEQFVPLEQLGGKVLYVYWSRTSPMDRIGVSF
jgi:signal peptidase I